ncbi:MAG: hypothetical protein SGCHY_004173 [Lobulomycetales sp.]
MEGGLMVKAPPMVLREVNMSESSMDTMTEKMRKWLANTVIVLILMQIQVLSPIAKRIEAIDDQFKQQSISELDCANATLAAGLASAMQHQTAAGYNPLSSVFTKPSAAPVVSAKPRSLIELRQSYPSNPIVTFSDSITSFFRF